jgi:hypothetical protein
MGTALFVLLWWLALFGWWVALVGTNAGLELIAGACAALIAALLAAALWRLGLLRYRFEARWLAKDTEGAVEGRLGARAGARAREHEERRRAPLRDLQGFDLPVYGQLLEGACLDLPHALACQA